MEPLLRLIRTQCVDASGVLVVAIAGRSGSGKSTLAQTLSRRLPAAVVEGDDFYAGGVHLRDEPPAARAACCIDWHLQREVLTALRAGRPARYQAFDWDAFDNSRKAVPTSIAPARVILFEGTYSCRLELADLIDLRVLVLVDEATRMRRLHAREGGIGAWERQWLEAENAYFAKMRTADFDAVVTSVESA